MRRISIKAAKQISVEYDCPEVVIFIYDPKTGKQQMVTYGETVEQSEDAATAGNYLKKALNWPEELCNSKPARSKKVGKFLFKVMFDADDDFFINNRYLVDNNNVPYIKENSTYISMVIELKNKGDIVEFLNGIEIKPKYEKLEHYMAQFKWYIEYVNSDWKKNPVKDIKRQIRANERIYYSFGGNHEITIEECGERLIKPVKINIGKK